MNTITENRFSDRVENYVKYRPHYPQQLVDELMGNGYIFSGANIADVGSGTGISAKLFLDNKMKVFGIEPNDAMRGASETYLSDYLENNSYTSVKGSEQSTTLNNQSIDLVVAAQAFHWFDRNSFKHECKRILKPEGSVALIWNDRRTDTTDFLKVYEDFLKMFAIDYLQVNHKNIQDKKIFDDFFGEDNYKEIIIDNHQELDLLGLRGRVLSSSYMPNTDHKEYEYMMYVLRKIFQRYQENNKIKLEYDTRIYIGKIK